MMSIQAGLAMDFANAKRESNTDLVVLVHGLAANRIVMRPLANFIKSNGFATMNWGYPSIRRRIEDHSRELRHQFELLDEVNHIRRLHLVAHSMGGIIVRHMLADYQPTKLHRMVMLGPPNRGSRVASILARSLGLICKPLVQLSDSPDSFVNSLPEPRNLEVGVVSASRDRVVSLESTQLSQQQDHVIVHSGHTSMLFRREVAESVLRFLHFGKFSH
jgi:triacylglycerol esterase/lipase EstA (alpha/beta hydrolase family)